MHVRNSKSVTALQAAICAFTANFWEHDGHMMQIQLN